MDNARILLKLEETLQNSDLVVLADGNEMTDRLCRSEALIKSDKKITVISKDTPLYSSGKNVYLNVSEAEMSTLLDLYRSYEASDKLILLTDSRNYGSVWNYVDTGVLSPNDVFEALLA